MQRLREARVPFGFKMSVSGKEKLHENFNRQLGQVKQANASDSEILRSLVVLAQRDPQVLGWAVRIIVELRNQ